MPVALRIIRLLHIFLNFFHPNSHPHQQPPTGTGTYSMATSILTALQGAYRLGSFLGVLPAAYLDPDYSLDVLLSDGGRTAEGAVATAWGVGIARTLPQWKQGAWAGGQWYHEVVVREGGLGGQEVLRIGVAPEDWEATNELVGPRVFTLNPRHQLADGSVGTAIVAEGVVTELPGVVITEGMVIGVAVNMDATVDTGWVRWYANGVYIGEAVSSALGTSGSRTFLPAMQVCWIFADGTDNGPAKVTVGMEPTHWLLAPPAEYYWPWPNGPLPLRYGVFDTYFDEGDVSVLYPDLEEVYGSTDARNTYAIPAQFSNYPNLVWGPAGGFGDVAYARANYTAKPRDLGKYYFEMGIADLELYSIGYPTILHSRSALKVAHVGIAPRDAITKEGVCIAPRIHSIQLAVGLPPTDYPIVFIDGTAIPLPADRLFYDFVESAYDFIEGRLGVGIDMESQSVTFWSVNTIFNPDGSSYRQLRQVYSSLVDVPLLPDVDYVPFVLIHEYTGLADTEPQSIAAKFTMEQNIGATPMTLPGGYTPWPYTGATVPLYALNPDYSTDTVVDAAQTTVTRATIPTGRVGLAQALVDLPVTTPLTTSKRYYEVTVNDKGLGVPGAVRIGIGPKGTQPDQVLSGLNIISLWVIGPNGVAAIDINGQPPVDIPGVTVQVGDRIGVLWDPGLDTVTITQNGTLIWIGIYTRNKTEVAYRPYLQVYWWPDDLLVMPVNYGNLTIHLTNAAFLYRPLDAYAWTSSADLLHLV